MTSYRLVYSFTTCNVIPILEKSYYVFSKKLYVIFYMFFYENIIQIMWYMQSSPNLLLKFVTYLARMLITSSSYFVKLKYLCNSCRKSWHKMTCVETLIKTIYGIFNSRSKTANNILTVLCIVISSSEVIYLHIIRGHTHS